MAAAGTALAIGLVAPGWSAAQADTAGTTGEKGLSWQAPVRLAEDLGLQVSLAAADAGFVALDPTSVEEAADTRVLTSADGITWVPAADVDGVRLTRVTAGGPGFLAAGTSDAAPVTAGPLQISELTPVVATSIDGNSWDVVELEAPDGGIATDIAQTPVGLVAVGAVADAAGDERPAAWVSTGGTTWDRVPTEAFGDLGDLGGSALGFRLVVVAPAGAAAVVVGQALFGDTTGQARAWRSVDGETWEPVPAPARWESVLFAGGAAGESGTVVVGTPLFADPPPLAWATTEGGAWSPPEGLPVLPDADSAFVQDVAAGDGWYVAVGDDVAFPEDAAAAARPAIWTSHDATSWDRVPPADLDGSELADDTTAEQVTYRDGRWYVYGLTGAADTDPSWVLWIGEEAAVTPKPTGGPTHEPTPTHKPTPGPTTATPAIPTAVPAGGQGPGPDAPALGPVAGVLGATVLALLGTGLLLAPARRRRGGGHAS